MALASASSFIASTICEAIVAAETELTIFAIAAVVYVVCVGGLKTRSPKGKKTPPTIITSKTPAPTPQPRACEDQSGAPRRRTGESQAAERSSRTIGGAAAGGAWSPGQDVQRQIAKIRSLSQRRDLGGARGVFDALRNGGFSTDALAAQVYNTFVEACVHCGSVKAALEAFEEMKAQNVADVVGYNTVIKALLGQSRVADARALMEEMAQRGVPPNKITYNELLLNRVIAQDHQGMWGVIGEIRDAGLPVSVVACSILLKSLTPQSNPWEIKRVVRLIDEIEEPLDEVLICSVVDSCIRLKQLELLTEFVQRQRQTGGLSVCPAPIFGAMIKAYGFAGDMAQVRALWREMGASGVDPTEITLGCMMEALVSRGLAEEAWQLLREQLASPQRRGLVNTVIYSTVLKGFALARNLDNVFAVYAEMRANDVACNAITYNTMLDACAKNGGMRRATALMEHMKDGHVEPDIITFSTLVKGYCVEGDLSRAFAILEEMKAGGRLSPDEIMYNSLLDGCAKQKRIEEALKVLDSMRAAGVSPSNYTLSILVKLLGHARRLNQAFRMVEQLSSESGFRPNIQVYTCLVQACAINRQLERAFDVHDMAVADKKCRVDEKFYAVLVRCCLQASQLARAVEAVRLAYGLPSARPAAASRAGGRGRVGIEARALSEVMARLQGGTSEERFAHAELAAELEAIGVRASPFEACQ